MSILTENSKKMLVESMRSYVSEVLTESTSLTSKQATQKAKFVNENATYEQLLNITMNPKRNEKYLPAYVLEGAVAILHSACMTGRKNIGPNAITEGALKLHKRTGAVITESMMDAALTAVNEGCGLKIVGKILTEANGVSILDVMGITDSRIKQNIYNAARTKSGINKDDIVNHLKTKFPTDPNIEAKANDIANTIEREVHNGDGTLRGLRKGYIDVARRNSRAAAVRKLNTTAPNALSPNELARLNRRINGMPSVSNSIEKAANSAAGKTPWSKIALGVGAAGVAGLGAYKYWKNKKAMEADRDNGTQTF